MGSRRRGSVLTRRPALIITADDFGRDEACTAAIADSLAAGAITSASIMPTGKAYALACDLAHAKGLTDRIGVHLSLDEGRPLSREMAAFADAGGDLCVRRTLKPLGRELSRAVEAELDAQIRRVLACRIHPTHLDSHRHIHTAFPIGRLVVRLARRYGIPYVRSARNLDRRGGVVGAYKWMFNRYVAARVRTADHFGDIVDFYRSQHPHAGPGLIECMTHLDTSPRGLANRRLLTDDDFRRFLGNYELIGHAQLPN
jgi:hypothetical protein